MLTYSVASNGQGSYQSGILPVLNVNKSISEGWSANVKWESRQSLASGQSLNESRTEFRYILSDISLITSKKVGLNNSLAGGYLMRIRGDKWIHRAIQQFTLVKRYSTLRLSHRFSTDQTFDPEELTELRLRYRITVELPLEGASVDPREFYVKINNEYLNSFQGKTYELEIRTVPLLGFGFTDSNKIEVGIDYRADAFLKNELSSNIWININWFVTL
ncbi:DUF2490 domain-containing protein [Rhodocytophaga aerolata]|uniref:DUF2490 domain-containing protein n=1 Tax=Rhodocytophaga aerolata TaxID=455078 RepID=UPI0036702A4C